MNKVSTVEVKNKQKVAPGKMVYIRPIKQHKYNSRECIQATVKEVFNGYFTIQGPRWERSVFNMQSMRDKTMGNWVASYKVFTSKHEALKWKGKKVPSPNIGEIMVKKNIEVDNISPEKAERMIEVLETPIVEEIKHEEVKVAEDNSWRHEISTDKMLREIVRQPIQFSFPEKGVKDFSVIDLLREAKNHSLPVESIEITWSGYQVENEQVVPNIKIKYRA